MRREIGGFRWEVADEQVEYEGTPIGAPKSVGDATPIRVVDTGNLILDCALVCWPKDAIDLRAIQKLNGPVQYDRLVHGGRLGVRVLSPGTWTCDLKILRGRADNPLWSNLVKAAKEDLDLMADGDSFELLGSFGAIEIDLREVLLGDTSAHKYALAMTCEEGDVDAIAAAYVLTRCVPTHRGFMGAA